MAIALNHMHSKHLELTAEAKQSDDVLQQQMERSSSSSESLEICYSKQLSTFSQQSHHCKLEYNSVSSNEQEDEDSKMAELPQSSNVMHSIKLSLSPSSNKIKYSPIRHQSTSKYHKYKQLKLVNSMDECTTAEYQTRNRINCTHAHYWKRMLLFFCLVSFICCIIALLFTLSDEITLRYSSVFVFFIPLIMFGLVLFRLCLKYNALNGDECHGMRSIEASQYYQDLDINNNVIQSMNNDKHFTFDISNNMIYSFDATFSGFAALNTILSSIYNNRLFIQFPMKPMDIDLRDIYYLIKHKIMNDYNVNIKQFPNIKLNAEIIDIGQLSLMTFKRLLKITHEQDGYSKYVRTFFIAQFNKEPLFYCDMSRFKKVTKWITNHGYFSPIIGYHIDEKQEMYVLVVDVNANYGHYLVPIQRMFQAMKYCNHHGQCGGLLKLEAHFIS